MSVRSHTMAGVSVAAVSDLVLADPTLRDALNDVGTVAAVDLTGPGALRPFVIKGLVDAGRTVLAVAATEREAEDLVSQLGALMAPEEVAFFPPWETLPHERLSPRSDTVGVRLAVLRRLRHPSAEAPAPRVVVTTVRSVLQPQVKGLADLVPVDLRVGEQHQLDDVVRQLVDAAYSRVDLVEKRGEFAVRGGIVDVFPPTEEFPVRVEFWGDDVEEIRTFSVADQRSLEARDHLFAPPCRELLLTEQVRERARELAEQHPELAEIAGKLAEGIAVEGMESLAPALVDEMELLVDLLPEGAHVLLLDPERVRTRAHDLVATSEEFLAASWAVAAAGGNAPIDLGAASYRTVGDVRTHALGRGLGWWTLAPFGIETGSEDDGHQIAMQPADAYHGDFPAAIADLGAWLKAGRRVVVLHEGHGLAERTAELLRNADLPVRLTEELADRIDPDLIHVSTATLTQGLVDDAGRFAIITGHDLTGQQGSTQLARKMPTRRKRQIDPLELKPGDFIVHDQHGVGRYVEMRQREVAGATREYLVIEYAASKKGQPADRLFVPTDQLDQVTRYVGGDQPSLDKLGGSDWAKRKGRARKAVREIAAELIKLYAARQATQGHAFGPDTPWQRELEDAFPYAETPDQLATIDEVKADMQRQIPMDRLICGDVGYGKTEIAVRAAFKAVQDGKQVAVLVPTTLLVQQHYGTFAERMSGFPVRLGALSRFQTDKEAKAVLESLADGSIDVVIGTHRLLGNDIRFKDLGLIIVDEEQRFGVEHKERLKHLRTAVDVLAMSATPIPRTLEMAITGIREMSTIATPPEERHPVLTYVGAYEDKQVIAAIRRELLRDGQVFFIHNRVDSIERVAARLRELVPEARVAVAHGQMGENQLEQVMLDFWEKRFDVLVCTTIVESGIDVSNANTMIIERADMLGLSQLHQLRGRVGRSRDRAYAYFLYPAEKPLTETAHERLATLAQHSDLGGGMAIAMKDLEIRGAGNLLGGQQSGHIADVGFDLYVRLVGEAVEEYKGGPVEEDLDVRVELPVDAHLPHSYVGSERLRLEMYKRLAEVRDDEMLEQIRAELKDRYGEPPAPVEALLEVARFRARARQAGLTEVVIQGKHVRFAPVELRDSQKVRLDRLHPGNIVKGALRTILVPLNKPLGGQAIRDVELLDWAREVIDSIIDPERSPSASSELPSGGQGREVSR